MKKTKLFIGALLVSTLSCSSFVQAATINQSNKVSVETIKSEARKTTGQPNKIITQTVMGQDIKTIEQPSKSNILAVGDSDSDIRKRKKFRCDKINLEFEDIKLKDYVQPVIYADLIMDPYGYSTAYENLQFKMETGYIPYSNVKWSVYDPNGNKLSDNTSDMNAMGETFRYDIEIEGSAGSEELNIDLTLESALKLFNSAEFELSFAGAKITSRADLEALFKTSSTQNFQYKLTKNFYQTMQVDVYFGDYGMLDVEVHY